MRSPKELSNDSQAALNKAMDYLARRDHSEAELRQKMQRRFTGEAIQSALNEVKTRGWMKSPHELAEQVAHQLLQRGKGPLYIRAYLQKKGLPFPHLEEEEIRIHCERVLEQKFPQWREMNFEERQVPMRFLIRRGFPEGMVLRLTSN